jgi:hypothetical protein
MSSPWDWDQTDSTFDSVSSSSGDIAQFTVEVEAWIVGCLDDLSTTKLAIGIVAKSPTFSFVLPIRPALRFLLCPCLTILTVALVHNAFDQYLCCEYGKTAEKSVEVDIAVCSSVGKLCHH